MRPLCLLLLALAVSPARADDDALDHPPLSLARCLPSHDRCKQALAVVERWLGWARDAWDATEQPPREWELLQCRHWTWERAARATDPKATERERRWALHELVDWHGWRMILSGELPDPIPLDWIPVAPHGR